MRALKPACRDWMIPMGLKSREREPTYIEGVCVNAKGIRKGSEGKERKGKERKERKGKGRKGREGKEGKERKGRKGKGRKGREGKGREGKETHLGSGARLPSLPPCSMLTWYATARGVWQTHPSGAHAGGPR